MSVESRGRWTRRDRDVLLPLRVLLTPRQACQHWLTQRDFRGTELVSLVYGNTCDALERNWGETEEQWGNVQEGEAEDHKDNPCFERVGLLRPA